MTASAPGARDMLLAAAGFAVGAALGGLGYGLWRVRAGRAPPPLPRRAALPLGVVAGLGAVLISASF